MAIITRVSNKVGRPLPTPGKYAYMAYRTRSVQTGLLDRSIPLTYRARYGSQVTQKHLGNSPTNYLGAFEMAYGSPPDWEGDVTGTIAAMSNAGKLAYNRAYTKVMESVTEGSAKVLALIMERVKTAEMITDRYRQILAIAEAANAGSLRKLSKSLKTNPSDLRRRHKRSSGFLTNPSATFLEVSWGWLPLLQELAAMVAHLGRDIPPMVVFGTGGYPVSIPWDYGTSTSLERGYGLISGQFRVKVGMTLTPQSVLQSEIARLGLTNPGASAYEVLSYSWLVDYFVNVGQVIEGWDDALTTRHEKFFVTRFMRTTYSQYSLSRWGLTSYGYELAGSRISMDRYVGPIIGPFLTYDPNPFSAKRLAYLSSLLILRLKKFKKLSFL